MFWINYKTYFNFTLSQNFCEHIGQIKHKVIYYNTDTYSYYGKTQIMIEIVTPDDRYQKNLKENKCQNNN